MVNEFDPQAFGSVLARLDSQDRSLVRLEKEVADLSDKLDTLLQQSCQKNSPQREKTDWVELLVGAILGAVAYFIGAKLLGSL